MERDLYFSSAAISCRGRHGKPWREEAASILCAGLIFLNVLPLLEPSKACASPRDTFRETLVNSIHVILKRERISDHFVERGTLRIKRASTRARAREAKFCHALWLDTLSTAREFTSKGK